jgi:spore maturation protein CgeB
MSKTFKILYVASMSKRPDRDGQWVRVFSEAGLDVTTFAIDDALKYSPGVLGKLERRFQFGFPINRVRKKLLELIKENPPNWVHFRLPLIFDKTTILKIKEIVNLVTVYFNDDPFSSKRVSGLHYLYRKAIPAYDAHFTYRQRNIEEFYEHGAAHVAHTPPVYVPWLHYPPKWKDAEREKYLCDAAFIGHFEDDNRLNDIDALLRAGLKINLRGGGWDRYCVGRPAEKLVPVKNAFGEEYNKLYEAASAGLCFFSKINRDELTERALEIPAVGGVLVCERTDEVETHFEDRKEAFFFSDTTELMQVIDQLKNNRELRKRIAEAGRLRLQGGHHSINHRLEDMLKYLVQWNLISIDELPKLLQVRVLRLL